MHLNLLKYTLDAMLLSCTLIIHTIMSSESSLSKDERVRQIMERKRLAILAHQSKSIESKYDGETDDSSSVRTTFTSNPSPPSKPTVRSQALKMQVDSNPEVADLARQQASTVGRPGDKDTWVADLESAGPRQVVSMCTEKLNDKAIGYPVDEKKRSAIKKALKRADVIEFLEGKDKDVVAMREFLKVATKKAYPPK
jgi:hypothetical protein